jgi:hypothetical protein
MDYRCSNLASGLVVALRAASTKQALMSPSQTIPGGFRAPRLGPAHASSTTMSYLEQSCQLRRGIAALDEERSRRSPATRRSQIITLRRSAQRRHVRAGELDCWQTFDPDALDEARQGSDSFGLLGSLDEIRFSADGGAIALSRGEAEVLSVVHRGAVSQVDAKGHSEVIHAGEVQCTAGTGLRGGETNASLSEGAHVHRISLGPSQFERAPTREQGRFNAAERRNQLCAVASFDGRRGSLRLREDAIVYAGVLDAGHQLAHDLSAGRSAWLQVVLGELRLHEISLVAGDGAGFSDGSPIAFTALRRTEVLLIDLGPWSRSGGPGSPQPPSDGRASPCQRSDQL